MRGRAGSRRAFEPSNLRATSLRYQPKNGIRPRHDGDVGKNPPAQPMTDLAESASLDFRELETTFQLHLDDAVLRGQILVPRQQLLVHRPVA
jgi:hypothetical protein